MSKMLISLLLLFATILALSTLPFKPSWTAQAATIEGHDTSLCSLIPLRIVQEHQTAQEDCRTQIRENVTFFDETGDQLSASEFLSNMKIFLVSGDFIFFDYYKTGLERVATHFPDREDFVLEIRMLLLERQILGGSEAAIRDELTSSISALERFTLSSDAATDFLREFGLAQLAARVAHAQYQLGDLNAVLKTFTRYPSIDKHAPHANLIRILSSTYANRDLLQRDVSRSLEEWSATYSVDKTSYWAIARLQELGYLRDTKGATQRDMIDGFVACASRGAGKCKFYSASSDRACSYMSDAQFFCIRK